MAMENNKYARASPEIGDSKLNQSLGFRQICVILKILLTTLLVGAVNCHRDYALRAKGSRLEVAIVAS